MSDIGSALVSGLGDLGSSLGDMFSGVGNAMMGAGGQMASAGAAPAAAPASAPAPTVDPAIAAPLTLTPPAEGTPQQQAGSVGGTQPAPQPAPQPPASDDRARVAGIDAIRKLFAAGRRNPYQTGATDDPMGTWEGEGGAPASEPRPKPPWFKWAGGKPYQPTAQPQGDEPVDVPDFRRNPAAIQAGQGAVDQAIGRNPAAQAAGEAAVGGATAPEVLKPAELPSPGAAATGALSRLLGGPYGMAARTAAGVLAPTPAETGEFTPAEPNFVRPDAPQTGQKAPDQGVVDPEIKAGGPGHGAITRAPATGKPVKTVDPKSGKPVDPKTGAPLPTKKPGAGGEYQQHGRERPYWIEQPPAGQSQLMRDAGGMQGVPQMLGMLAQIALPLIGGLMMGGGGRPFGGHHGFRSFPFGRGGHGRFGGPWRGGHPGGFGSGMWPYHHPGMGWRGFGYHPGGGWQPLHPRFGPGGGGPLGFAGGGGGLPLMDIIGAMLGGGQQGQGQGGGFRRGGGFGNNNYNDPVEGPWSGNPFLKALVGKESGGRNSGAPGGGPAGDNGLARGYFNIQTPTWTDFAPKVPGASRYASADQAPYEIQHAVANTIPVYRFGDDTRRILHEKFGDFDERLTVGQMADRTGGMQTAGGIPTSGVPTTPTGDTRVATQ